MRLLAPAKVNLFIDVLDRRPDGYHNLDAVNVSVDLFDEIDLVLNDTGRHTLECDTPGIPLDETNHLIKAANEILKGTRWGVSMRLAKHIPPGAGLGGGTSDAATLIRYLTRVFSISGNTLMARALAVGSDVPYSLIGGPARVRGRGEIVDRIADVHPLRMVVLDPGSSHETGAIYGRMPPSSERPHPPAEAFIQVWKKGDLALLGSLMFNAFQEVVFSRRPRLAELRDLLLRKGCLGATLTGTGSHLVGLLAPESPTPEAWTWNEPEKRPYEVHTLPADFSKWFRRL
ncbi:MAG: 4-(cytidine 5'-diphospho)-2-C-methyl-D-erythritol kinase [Candidatus Omnitrophica bacterium]|nr:4-(cytidine 5'-diphospho)-2-C-methyl-D-erythritol kinase [Candidatus Omnitrophota bacterium]